VEPTRIEPRRTRRTWWIAIAVVFGVCTIAGVSRSVVLGALRQDKQPTSQPVGTSVDQDQPPRDGQFAFTVHSVSCGHATIDNGWLHAQAKGRFCVVAMTVTNVGSEDRRFADGVQIAYGPNGERYAADTGAGVVANGNGDGVWAVINPGVSQAVKVVYDVPAAATITKLVLHDSAWSLGATVSVTAS
jgi:hypothetical protein